MPGSSPQFLKEEAQAQCTYKHFKILAAREPGSGVQSLLGIEHLESPPAEYLDERSVRTFYAHLDEFRQLAPEECPGPVKWGVSYRSFVVNSPVYCAHLLRQFVLKGGQTKEYTLGDVMEGFYLAENVKTVVNCSGMGLGDPKSFIIRGRKNTTHCSFSIFYILYSITRSQATLD